MLSEVPRFRRVFLHFFDMHFLHERGIDGESRVVRKEVKAECKLATRFAVLAADEVLVPAASYCESDDCFEIIDGLRSIYKFGKIWLVGGGDSLNAFIEEKLSQYPPPSSQFKHYKEMQRRIARGLLTPPFRNRRESATRDIVAGWLGVLNTNRIGLLVEGSNLHLPKDIESRWEQIPDQLEGKAFIVPHVEPLLFNSIPPGTIHNRIHGIINEEYFDSFTREFCCSVVTDLGFLAGTHSIPSYDRDIPYRYLVKETCRTKLLKRIESANGVKLLRLQHDQEWLTSLAAACVGHDRAAAHFYHQRDYVTMEKLERTDIGVITALPEEFAAVCEVLECKEPVDLSGYGGGRKYSIGSVTSHTGARHAIAVALLTDMGNNSAAIRATQMMGHCKHIDHIIMTGIAGAVPYPEKPEHHVRLGDIVVSDCYGVVQYDLTKESLDKRKRTKITVRNKPRPPGASLIDAVNWLIAEEMSGETPWEAFLDGAMLRLGSGWQRPGDDHDRLQDWNDGWPPTPHPEDAQRRLGRPRVFHGPIASGNTLLKNPRRRDNLRDMFGVKAVEMEGAGIADATWNQERGYLVLCQA
jgi:nucleoside phosphorylase